MGGETTSRVTAVLLALLASLAGCGPMRAAPEPLSLESLCADRSDAGSHGRHHPVLGRYVDDRIAGDSAGPIVDIGAVQSNSRMVSPSAGRKPLQSTRAVRTYIRAHGGGVIAYWAGLTVGPRDEAVDGTAFADGAAGGAGRAAFVRARGADTWSFAHVDEPYDPVCD